MKTLSLSLFLLGSIFFASDLFSQDSLYTAVSDSICIELDEIEMLNFDVFENDENIDPTVGASIVFSEPQNPCFNIDSLGIVRYVDEPGISEYCPCGTYTMYYAAISNDDPDAVSEATVTIVIKCPKPDCSLFNLLDFQEDPVQEGPGCVSVCDSSTTTFYVPFNPNNTYNWIVNSNGGSTSPGANQAEINVTWGAEGAGLVVLQDTNSFGIVNTISICINIMEGPTADFSSDGYTCLNSPITFTNLSSNADEFDWDFGDGTYLLNIKDSTHKPTHTYDTPGTYAVTLYATQYNYDNEGNQLCCCTDSVTYDVVVDPLPGPNIYWISTLCEGDSSKYWTDASNCSTYDWIVSNTNGDTLSFVGQGTDTICVLWNSGFDGVISLAVDGCDSTYCANPTTVSVPIIPSVSSINGLDEVCLNSTHIYSLPKWHSVEYLWTVLDTNGIPVPFEGQGGNQISINWTVAGISSIHVDYQSDFLNGLPDHNGTECTGVADLAVNVKPFFDVFNPSPIVCVGSTSFISATSFPSSDYDWTVTPSASITSGGDGTANLTISWDSGPGTYTVTAVPNDLSVYCNDIETVIIQVVEVPPPLTIEGPDSICAGESVLYTVTTSETGVGFTWNVIGGTPTSSNANSILVTWAGPGSISVFQSLLSPPFCQSDTIGLNVIEKSVAGPLNVAGSAACTNFISTYTLTPPQINDANITWSIDSLTDGSIISGQGTEIIQVQWNNDPGVVSVDVDVEVCGDTTSFSLVDTLYSPIEPVITQVGVLCPGVMAELRTQGGFTSYAWSNGSVSDTAMISTGGNYSVTTIDINGCSASDYFNASEVPGPIANISSGDYPVLCINDGGSVNIVAQNNPNYYFEWVCNNIVVVPYSATANFLHNNTGVVDNFAYYFNVVDSLTGCINTSELFYVSQDSCVGGPPCVAQPHTVMINYGLTNSDSCDQYTFTPTLVNATVGSWTFGDGTGSSAPIPTHKYTKAGCYNVVLNALVPNADSTGFCGVRRDTAVCVPVAADFSFQYLDCGDVKFTDLSTYITDTIISWNWTFSSMQNPTQNFGSGPHSVTLEVTTLSGCKATVTKNIVIGSVTINSISAISIPDPPCVGDAVTFSTVAPGAVDWFWDFDDGATFSGQSPIHAYNSSGTYNVVLTVTDKDGCMDTDTISILVNPAVPDGLGITPGDQVICEGDTITLSAPAGYSYLWSSLDTTQTIDVFEEGTYSVVITDSNGCFRELNGVTISIYPGPIAAINGNPIICDAGCANLFAQQSASDSTYSWTNGSLGVVSTSSFLQVCSALINNPYTLTITDVNGCTDTSDPINVEVKTSPNFVVDVSPDACEGKPISLSVNPIEPNVNYNWSNGGSGSSIIVFQAGLYTAIGTDTISGCSHSASATVNPLPDLCLVPIGCYDVCVQDTICGPAGLASYTWLFDGSPTPGIIGMEHCVEAFVDGTYQLVASNSFGCVDTSDVLILEVINCDSTECDDLIVDFDYQLNQTGQPDSCCAILSYSNNSFNLQGMVIRSTDADLDFDITTIDPSLTLFGNTINSLTLTDIIPGNPIPSSLNGFVEFCIDSVYNYPQQVIIDWYDFDSEIVCSDTLIFHCPMEPECLYLANDSIYCVDGLVFYDMTICNPHTNDFDVTYVNFNVNSPPGIIITPPVLTFPPLAPGNCYTTTIQLAGSAGIDIAGDTLCYTLTAHNADPNVVDTALCCTFQMEYCIPIPICDPCEFVGIEGIQLTDSVGCCYQVDIYNNHDSLYFDEIAICVISPNTTITSIGNVFGSPWITSAPTSTTVSFLPTVGTVPLGISSLPEICFDTEIAPSQYIEIKWLRQGEIVCRDTTEIICHPDCGYFEEESISCSPNVNGLWNFSGTLFNNTIYQVDDVVISSSDPAVIGMAYPVTIAPNSSYSSINFDFGAPGQPGDTICFYVSMKTLTLNGDYLECCWFEHCVVLPACPDPTSLCLCDDDFYEHVANGITCVQDIINPNLYFFQLTDSTYFQDCDKGKWDFGDGTPLGNTFGGQGIYHEFGASGIKTTCVKVSRTDINGVRCKAKICKIQAMKSEFFLYPNPSDGMVNIISKNLLNNDLLIEVRDINNRPVLVRRFTHLDSDTNFEINLSDISPGIYFINFITGDTRTVEILSKQ